VLKDWVILGQGIAALTFLDEFLDMSSSSGRILQLSSEAMAPSCSLRSTAICCSNGIEKGLSPLGDLLFDSYHLAEDFFRREKPEGVYFGKQFSQCQKDGEYSPEQYERRFGTVEELSHLGPFVNKHPTKKGKVWDAYLLDPPAYLSWFEKRIEKKVSKSSLDFERRDDYVVNLKVENDLYILETLNKKIIKAKNIVLASGAYAHLMKSFLPTPFEALDKAKVVAGSYLVFDSIDWGEGSFVVSYNGHNYVYRHWDKTLLIGGTTDPNENGAVTAINWVKLKEMFEIGKNELELPFPAFERGQAFVGLRQKGVKRMPFWGEIYSIEDSHLFGLLSFYKNGYTFPFKGSKELCAQIRKKVPNL
jgi:hypothetical protein